MANQIDKIHYAVVISTDTALTSPSIGLKGGDFRYVTDGYEPNVMDTFETGTATPQDYTWNTDLLTKDGIKGLEQSIDIIAGGDYAFIANSSVKLVNKTNIGNSFHKTIESLGSMSVIGSSMTIYVIIDTVWYSKWNGMVTSNSFSDNTYTFSGADKLMNNTDTLNSVILGLINAEVNYNPLGSINVENLMAYRFDPDESIYSNQTAFGRKTGFPVGESMTRTPDEMFGGVGFTAGTFVSNQKFQRKIQYITPKIDGVSVFPKIGDTLKFNSDDTLHAITHVQGNNNPSRDFYSTTITIDTIDDASVDYTFLFGDKRGQFHIVHIDAMDSNDYGGTDGADYRNTGLVDQFDNPVFIYENGALPHGKARIIKDIDNRFWCLDDADGVITENPFAGFSLFVNDDEGRTGGTYRAQETYLGENAKGEDNGEWTNLETIKTPNDDEKCFFTLYHPVADTGITSESIEDDGSITVLNEGVSYEFPYIKNDKGGIVISEYKSTNQIKPIKTEYFTLETDIFAEENRVDWGSFETIMENDAVQYNSLLHDMNPTSLFSPVSTGVDDKFLYFLLTFNTEDIEGRDELQLGTMLKGVFDGDNQAWSNPQANPAAPMRYMSSNYSNGDVPTYPTTKIYPDAKTCAMGQNQYFEIKTYTIVKDYTYGRIPVYDASILLPNVCDTSNSAVRDDGDSTVRSSFQCSSVPVTNIPMYDTGVVSMGNPQYTWKAVDYVNNTAMYPFSAFDVEDAETPALTPSPLDASTTELLVSIRAFTPEAFKLEHYDPNGVITTTEMDDQQRLSIMLNGFCLFSTMEVSEAEVNLTYRADAETTPGTYIDILKTITENDGNYSKIDSSRESWIAGLQIKEQTQRYGIVTNLMKQGFCTGYTNRFGVDTYKTIPETADEFIDVDNNIISSGSIKSFTSSPASKIYNEFELTGDFETIKISNVKEETFPALGEDYSEYVTGIDYYYKAKSYWGRAREAFTVTGTIHKAPSDRSKLDFATGILSNDYFSDTSMIGKLDGYPVIAEGTAVQFDGSVIDMGAYLDVTDVVELVSTDGTEFVKVQILFKNDTIVPNIISGLVIDTNVIDTTTTFAFDLMNSWSSESKDNTYAEEYLDLLIQWSTYPKLMTTFEVPLTADTVKWELMDTVHFNDPIITPDINEYGEGYLTKVSCDTNKNKVKCQITFKPDFFIKPNAIGCNFIDEEIGSTDFIDEETGSTDFIDEVPCE